jgi:hypothetical protein
MESPTFLSNYSCVIVLPEDRLLEDRIRELCARAVDAQDPESLRVVLTELRAALGEHHARLKALVAGSIGAGCSALYCVKITA